MVRHSGFVALLILTGAGCAGTPSVHGVAGVAPSPSTAWTPPPRETQERDTLVYRAVPPDLEQRIKQLTLAEVVDLGLRNNPQTRFSWANARAAAAAYGSERGAYLPTIDGEVTGTRLKTVASQGRSAVTQSVLSPSLSLTYLLFDFGGRSGTVGAARNSLLAANYTHNAALQDVVLQIQTALFPVHRQSGPAGGSTHHCPGGANQPEGSGGTEAGRGGHDCRCAASTDRGLTGRAGGRND